MTFPSNLPVPTVLSTDTFDTIVSRMLARVKSYGDERVATGEYTENPYDDLTEADLVSAIFQACAYENIQIREQANNEFRQLLVAFATGDNLLLRAIDVGIDARNPEDETDEHLRRRIRLQWHSLSASGTVNWYYHKAITPNTDPNNLWSAEIAAVTKNMVGKRPNRLIDVLPGDNADKSVKGGTAYLYLQVYAPTIDNEGNLSHSYQAAQGGIPTQAFIDVLFGYIDKIENRIICDTIRIKPVKTVGYDLVATLTLEPTAVRETVLESARASLKTLTDAAEEIGRNILVSSFYEALNVPGVAAIRLDVTPTDASHTPKPENGGTGVVIENTPLKGSVYAETAEEWDDAYVPTVQLSTVDTQLGFTLRDVPYNAEMDSQFLDLGVIPFSSARRQVSLQLPRAYHGAGDTPVYTYQLQGLPSGLNFNSNTRFITGRVSSTGVTEMAYQVSDGTNTVSVPARLEIV